jgi:hypothetical protein
MTSLTLVRRIKARPSIVFDALTTPEGIACWWGPDDGPVLVAGPHRKASPAGGAPTTAPCWWRRPTREVAAASGYASACSTEASTRAAANISKS